ncbi:MAG: TAXI family TRAP transporter solute-binding subunit [Alphaproteobacteria bacterium]|nr:TAXI family TRAP transporter solute-binding subunit [Alphaproteobacteria bacterium]
MKFRSKLVVAALAGVLLAGTAAQAQEMTFFRIGTGGAGGTYFPIGGLIANAISNPPGSGKTCEQGGSCGVPGLIAIAQSTNASAHNVTAVNSGQMEAGLTGAATLYFAYHGTGKFEGKAKPNLRIIAKLYPEDLHLVMKKGMKMDSLADLKGKRVGIAQAGSGTQIAVELILAQYGVNRDNIDEAELNNSQSAERIADGHLDAYFYVAGTPVAAMIQLDNTKGMELYSFSDAEVNAAHDILPYYGQSTIPAGTYAGIDYDVNTIAVNGILVTSIDQDEELIYQITKALWNKNTRRLLDTGHAKGKVIREETALEGIKGLDVPLHPGAARYYEETGNMMK